VFVRAECCNQLINSDDKAVAELACQILLTMIGYRPQLVRALGALDHVGSAIQEKWRSSAAPFAANIRKLTSLFAESAEAVGA
jgi:hypothetical protein